MRHLKGLKIDYLVGEGDISLPEEFAVRSAEFRAVVIKDWIGALVKEFDAALEEMRFDFEYRRGLPSEVPPDEEDIAASRLDAFLAALIKHHLPQ